MRPLFLALLLLGCEPVTIKARLRVHAQSYLGQCLNAGGEVRQCLRENAAWCKAHGLEASCGADEYWPPRPNPHRAEAQDEDG